MHKKVTTYINQAFNGEHVEHFERTVHWVKVLKPDADDALLIAAYAHDLERGLRKPEHQHIYSKSKAGFRDTDFLTFHQEEGAKLIGDFLRSEGAQEGLIERVKHLVSKHEIGGDSDQNLLKDCDSISFFETNASHFISKKALLLGKKIVKDKFDWMFNRITSEKAKEIAKPLYLDALQKLDEL